MLRQRQAADTFTFRPKWPDRLRFSRFPEKVFRKAGAGTAKAYPQDSAPDSPEGTRAAVKALPLWTAGAPVKASPHTAE